jgi:membrane protease YdiL (CAAX protease family)
VRTLGLLGLVIGVLGLTAVASPWVAAALGPGFTFARVYDRVFETSLVVALVCAWRPLDLGSAEALGLRRAAWRRDLARGAIAGIAGVAVGLIACWLGGALVPSLRYPWLKTLRKMALGGAAAVAIGAGEEMIFRGVLLRRLARDTSPGLAVAGTTLIYAAVHAIRSGGGGLVAGPWAGVERTVALFAPLTEPAALPGLAGLAGLGLVLAAARLHTGSLWVAIGIHAAWVAVFRVGRLFFELGRTPLWLVGPGWPPLIGGFAGWVAIGATFLLMRRPQRRVFL